MCLQVRGIKVSQDDQMYFDLLMKEQIRFQHAMMVIRGVFADVIDGFEVRLCYGTRFYAKFVRRYQSW